MPGAGCAHHPGFKRPHRGHRPGGQRLRHGFQRAPGIDAIPLKAALPRGATVGCPLKGVVRPPSGVDAPPQEQQEQPGRLKQAPIQFRAAPSAPSPGSPGECACSSSLIRAPADTWRWRVPAAPRMPPLKRQQDAPGHHHQALQTGQQQEIQTQCSRCIKRHQHAADQEHDDHQGHQPVHLLRVGQKPCTQLQVPAKKPNAPSARLMRRRTRHRALGPWPLLIFCLHGG